MIYSTIIDFLPNLFLNKLVDDDRPSFVTFHPWTTTTRLHHHEQKQNLSGSFIPDDSVTYEIFLPKLEIIYQLLLVRFYLLVFFFVFVGVFFILGRRKL